MITKEQYLEAKKLTTDYEFEQLNKPIVSGSLPTDEQVIAWSEEWMKRFSWAPKHYHKMGALDLLKLIRGNDR